MKKMISLIVLASLFGWSGVSFADQVRSCPNGQRMRKIGNLQTGSANITTAGFDVAMVTVSCGGSACTAGIYNADTLGSSSNSNVQLEPGAAASESETLIFETPMSFDEGITVVDDGNVNAVGVYSCQP